MLINIFIDKVVKDLNINILTLYVVYFKVEKTK
jgi:hypothetical protein